MLDVFVSFLMTPAMMTFPFRDADTLIIIFVVLLTVLEVFELDWRTHRQRTRRESFGI